LLKSLYPNSERYVRFKSARRFVDEIKAGISQFPNVRSICFFDDTLTLKKDFIREFSELYRQEVGLPYTCNDRVNQITPENVHYLKASGCVDVAMGIESGNDRIRNEIMRRNVTAVQIVDAFGALKAAGIRTSAFNIVGVPGESMETILDTITLNAKARPDRYINAYFNAYIGTDLYRYCHENGLTINDPGASLFDRPNVTLQSVTWTQLRFFYKYFAVLAFVFKCVFRLPGRLSQSVTNVLKATLASKSFPHGLFEKMYIFDISGVDRILRRYTFIFKLVHYFRTKLR
jgi:hypothetical protein